MSRAGRSLPFADTKGVTFTYWVPDHILVELHRIDMELGGQLGGPARDIEAAERERYVVRSLMEEAIASSQIEGAAVTRRVA
ncbi:MAG: hypothetical protein R3284_12850 [Rubricoccaceae bacterium]|nr:hypothetical protein [Rubricoccaceae bacterium]